MRSDIMILLAPTLTAPQWHSRLCPVTSSITLLSEVLSVLLFSPPMERSEVVGLVARTYMYTITLFRDV
jgi:hypothetical protein